MIRREMTKVRTLKLRRTRQSVVTGLLSMFDITGRQHTDVLAFRMGDPSDDLVHLRQDLVNVGDDMRKAIKHLTQQK